jgi:N-acetylglutamate synthase/N-acetylornithine aminotransferase
VDLGEDATLREGEDATLREGEDATLREGEDAREQIEVIGADLSYEYVRENADYRS